MAVKMVFAFLGKEFDRKEDLPWVFFADGFGHRPITQVAVEYIGLATNFTGGMGVRVGDQGNVIQGR